MIFSRQHQHRREAVAVQAATAVPFTPRSTVILWRCPCGDVSASTVTGTWTLAQVRGEAEKEQRERIETDLLIARLDNGQIGH